MDPAAPLGEPVTIGAVTLVASPTGEAVAYIAFPFTVQFIDVASGQASPVIEADDGGDFGAWAWRPDGQRFATAGSDGYVRVWDWRTGELIAERQLATGHIAALDYTRDGELLLVGERAGSLYTIDPETLQPLSEPVHVKTGIVWGYVSPDSRRALALGVGEFGVGEFALIDLVEGRVTHRGEIGFAPGDGDFSPDGRRFALGGGLTGEVRVLDVDRGEWTGPFRVAHSGLTVSVAYAPDGATFATAGGDGRVAHWDGRTGAPLSAVQPTRAAPTDAQYLPDGYTILISSLDGAISTWDTRPGTRSSSRARWPAGTSPQDEWRDALGDRPYHETCPAA